MARSLWKIIAGIAAVLALAAAVFVLMIVRGTMGADDWAIRQVMLIAQTYLTPIVGFERSRFDWPGTLRLEGVTLRSREGLDVLAAEAFVVTLEEAPRVGSPIRISAMELVGGDLRLVRDAATGGFVGLTPIVRASAVRTPESVPAEARLSEVMRIRRLSLRDCIVSYSEGVDQPAMRLDGIDMVLHAEPSAPTDSAGPVWHRLDVELDRSPILALSVLGAVSLDTFAARVERADFSIALGEDTYEHLPPALQALAREHQARGSLRVVANGSGAISDPAAANIDATVNLDGFDIAFGGYHIPIDSATMELHVADGAAGLAPVRVDLLGGTITASATADLTADSVPITASWNANGLQLRTLLLSQPEPGQQPPLAGVVRSGGTVSGRITDLPASVEGRGDLNIDNARLLVIPVITQLSKVIDSLGVVFTQGAGGARVESTFDLTGDAVVFDRLRLENQLAVVDATGRVFYDQRLEMTASAGPIKKITGRLGRIGDLLGAVTGQLIQYRVRGTLAEPTVAVRPLGIGS